jgi:ferric-dicitrate binding protein FerR (iron transport regulator)
LLKLAGPSAEIPQQLEQRVYQKVRSEWQQSSQQARGRTAWSKRAPLMRWALPLAMAASVLVAVLLIPANPDAPLRSVGNVLADGRQVFVGDHIDTASDGATSILLDGDISLRVDNHTQLQIVAADEFALLSGRVYIDTGDRIYSDRHVTITTASGSATDIGTQFSVSYAQDLMSVAVREGRVDLSDKQHSYSAVRGQKVSLRDGQTAQIDAVEIAGAEWQWAIALAPDFDLEQHSVLDFLKWAARETGLELVFDDDQVRSAARTARSHGSISGLSPLEAVEAVLATTQFRYSIDGDTLLIQK